jgi:HEAT repeat protein
MGNGVIMKPVVGWALAVMGLTLAGCAANPYRPGSPAAAELRARALASLKQGVRYPHVPIVRCQAVEALQEIAPAEGVPWIRSALGDENAGVRFAACLALGTLRDTTSKARITACLDDPDPSVQVGAIFALHRLGDTSQTHRLPEYLLDAPDPAVRRNAATVLGHLGEPGAVKLLARVMNDSDEGLQLQALEAMALLGNEEARQQLVFLAHSGLGAREAFAITALGHTGDAQFAEMYAYKLKTAQHWETKLAAARALGRLGRRDGYAMAAKCVTFNRPDRRAEVVADDSLELQIVRIRSMAALALGDIGDQRALPPLADAIDHPYDPRVELAAALAILKILNHQAGPGAAEVPMANGR